MADIIIVLLSLILLQGKHESLDIVVMFTLLHDLIKMCFRTVIRRESIDVQNILVHERARVVIYNLTQSVLHY